MNALCLLALLLGLVGAIISNSNLFFCGVIMFGVVVVYFHREMSGAFIDLYSAASPTYIRYSTILTGGLIILVGLLGLLGFQFGAR
jgi:hypothetical protein